MCVWVWGLGLWGRIPGCLGHVLGDMGVDLVSVGILLGLDGATLALRQGVQGSGACVSR